MERYRKGSHTVHDIKYHFVWITKYRYRVLRGDIAIRIRAIIREECASKDVRIVKGVVSADHVHLMVSSPPSISPSYIAQQLKGKSSYKIQQEFPELKSRYWGRHMWARGYFCASSGAVTEEMLKAYIAGHTGDEETGDGFELEGGPA